MATIGTLDNKFEDPRLSESVDAEVRRIQAQIKVWNSEEQRLRKIAENEPEPWLKLLEDTGAFPSSSRYSSSEKPSQFADILGFGTSNRDAKDAEETEVKAHRTLTNALDYLEDGEKQRMELLVNLYIEL
mmetsp:Transcript_15304/g.23174  ORF Transcript_15304/g.23174 Transcript_15304/m.23174 type:complete len:130 (+) Transcript_15304:548-937(+)